MSMSVRDDATGLEWAGALGAARAVPDRGATSAGRRTCGCSPRSRASTARARRAARPADGRRRRDAARASSPQRRLHGVLRPALHGAPRRRRLVVRPGRSRWTTRRATCSRSSTTTACSASSARRRGGRWSAARGEYVDAGRPLGSTTSALGTKVTSVARDRRRRRGRPTATAPVDDVRRGRHRHPPRPGAGACWPSRPPPSARCSARCRTPTNPALLHTDTSLLPRARARPGVLELPPRRATTAAQVTVTYDLTRLQRLPTETHYLVTLGGEDLVDPATVIARMEYAHPLYTPTSVAAQPGCPSATPTGSPSPAPTTAGASTRTARVRGWRPPSGWAPLAPTAGCGGALRRHETRDESGWLRSQRDSRRPRPPRPADPRSTGPRSATPAASRSSGPSPTARTPGWSTSTTCPTTACSARFEARDHLGVAGTRRSAATSTAYLARHGVDLTTAAGRADPDGRARPGLRLLLQPDQRLLVLRRRRRARRPRSSRCTTPTATGTPTSSTPTSRAGRAPTSRCTSRRSTASTAATSSPCRCPATGSTSRSPCTPTTAPTFSAVAGRARAAGPAGRLRRGARRPQASAGALLIRMHGIWLWARRLPRPAPPHPPPAGVS